jgi:hypothetical protein
MEYHLETVFNYQRFDATKRTTMNFDNHLLRPFVHTAIFLATMVVVSAAGSDSVGQQTSVEPGFELLFNGDDLTGWNYLPTTEQQKKSRDGWLKSDPNAPAWPIVTKKVDFDGKTETDDGRFVANDGTLSVTVPAAGRTVQFLYTQREFSEDFILKLEFRASENADSGVFIRGKQLQCRDYPNAGPYKSLGKFKPGDWNELIVSVTGTTAHCTCNGEVLETAFEVPASGPIGIEGDNGKFEYRNIRIADGKLKPTNKVSSWSFELNGDGKGNTTETDEAITFTTMEAGAENWHVQAYQVALHLEEGATYTVAFEIQSPDEVNVFLQGIINEDDWHEIGLHEEIPCTQEYRMHEVTFTATDVVANNNRIGFLLGGAKGSVSVKNMTLTKK